LSLVNQRLEGLITGIAVAAAVAVAAAIVHREFIAPKRTLTKGLEYFSAWPELLAAGRRLGDSAAPIKLIEFADLQCPFCRSFNETIRRTRSKYGNRVEMVFIHHPLAIHRVAMPAARAAECAHDQGRFLEFVDQAYAAQDSMAVLVPGERSELETWIRLAVNAGVGDTSRFHSCAAATAVPTIVQAGMKAARQFGIRGTPTIMINGWRFSIPPSEAELHRRIDRLLAGKSPLPFLSRLF
jgi:protein-disulfide isomerase